MHAALAAQMPELLPLLDAKLLEKGAGSLGAELAAVRYRVDFVDAVDGVDGVDGVEIDRRIADFLGAQTVSSSRVKHDGKNRGQVRVVALKKVVLSMQRAAGNAVTFELKAGNEASAKPTEVLAAAFAGLPVRRIIKLQVVFQESGQ